MQGSEVVDRIIELHQALDKGALKGHEAIKVQKEILRLSRAIVHTVCDKKVVVLQEEFPNLVADAALSGTLDRLKTRFNKYGLGDIEA
tara:strand:+ start:555 stop:818 length:264 start_codon:yes stop_codon:yes gene_type:complete